MVVMEQPNDTEHKPEVEVQPIDPSRQALVESWLNKIRESRDDERTKAAFERMRDCMRLATTGSQDPAWVKGNNYVLPVLIRHTNMAVSQLYAKHPTVIVKRKKRLLYQLWDGKMDSAAQAFEAASAGDVSQMPLLQDILQGQQYMQLLDRTAETLSILWEYFMSEQEYDYKSQLKATVRRCKVNAVAYAKLGFQRILEPNPDVTGRISDITSKIKHVESLIAKGEEPETTDGDKSIEDLRLNLADLEKQSEILVREGPVISFPRSTAIIIDRDCTHLKTLAGARWVAEQYDFTPEKIKQVYGKDVGTDYKEHMPEGEKTDPKKAKVAKLYEVWDREARQMFVVCEGHKDFILEPQTPMVDIERFFVHFPLVFNEVESETELYPPSDIWLARHPQAEINRARQGIREHRVANRPFYGSRKGALEQADREKLGNHASHEVIEFNALGADDDINKVVKKFDHAAIDPAQYDTEGHMQDIMRSVGTQEANLGPTSGATATESSIAENSRQSGQSDNVDDLDDWLTLIAKSGGQLMLSQLSKETVLEIAGPGAVWPDMPQSRAEIAKDLGLETEAGSSGRPNRAAELADMERAAPTMLQLPNINPLPFAQKYLRLLNIDLEEGVAQGMPSITALNSLMAKSAQAAQPGTGDPATDPASQGPQGAANAPAPAGGNEGSQPAFPAPGGGTAPMANQI
jgi:hypothetical protein